MSLIMLYHHYSNTFVNLIAIQNFKKLTIGGVDVTGPNGAGKFNLFIRCRTYKN